MGKRKERRRRMRARMNPNAKGTNRHHLCWARRDWNKGSQRLLRNHWYLVVEIPIYLHNEIHAKVSHVHLPNAATAREAYKHLQDLEEFGVISKDDGIEKRLAIMIGIFEQLDRGTASGFKEQLKVIK